MAPLRPSVGGKVIAGVRTRYQTVVAKERGCYCCGLVKLRRVDGIHMNACAKNTLARSSQGMASD